MQSKYTIYFLSGENKNNIFYVGITTLPLYKRLYDHLYGAKNKYCSNGNKNDKILEYWGKVEIHEIETIEATKKEAYLIETKYIKRYKNMGYDLCNSTEIPKDRKRIEKTGSITVRVNEDIHRLISEYLYDNGNDIKIGKFFEKAALEKVNIRIKEKEFFKTTYANNQ